MADNQPRPADGGRPGGGQGGAPGGREEGGRFGAGAQRGREGGERPRGRRPGGGGGRFQSRRKVCGFCVDNVGVVDYKDIARLRRHVAERGKIEPRRKLGTCAKHQRSLTVAIKRARHVGLLPFTANTPRG